MSGVGVTPSSSETTFSAPQMQVLTQYLEILVRQQNDELHERLDQMANRDNYEGNTRRRDNDGEPHQNRMEGVKLKIPPFKEKKRTQEHIWSGSSKLSICFPVTIILRSRELGW